MSFWDDISASTKTTGKTVGDSVSGGEDTSTSSPTVNVNMDDFQYRTGRGPAPRPISELLKAGPPYSVDEIMNLRLYRDEATRPTSADPVDHRANLRNFPETPGTSDTDLSQRFIEEVNAGIRDPHANDGLSQVLSRWIPATVALFTGGLLPPGAEIGAAVDGAGATGAAEIGAGVGAAGGAAEVGAGALGLGTGVFDTGVSGLAAGGSAGGAGAAASLIPGISNSALGLGALGVAGVAGNVIGANAQADAIKDAAEKSKQGADAATNATLQATRESIAAQEKMYNQQRDDFKPFLNLAPRSLATLQSSIYGGPQDYTDPSGVNQTATGQQFDLAGLSKQQTEALNTFNPQETEAYKWQLNEGLKNLDRTLRMQGRGNGAVATNAAMNFAGNLNATEYDKGYGRLSSLNDLNYNRLAGQKTDYQNSLLNLIKTAQGAAGSTSAAGQNFANNSSNASISQGNNLSNIATNNSTNQANASLAAGQSKANLWNGLSQIPFNLGSLAIQGGYKPFE